MVILLNWFPSHTILRPTDALLLEKICKSYNQLQSCDTLRTSSLDLLHANKNREQLNLQHMFAYKYFNCCQCNRCVLSTLRRLFRSELIFCFIPLSVIATEGAAYQRVKNSNRIRIERERDLTFTNYYTFWNFFIILLLLIQCKNRKWGNYTLQKLIIRLKYILYDICFNMRTYFTMQ